MIIEGAAVGAEHAAHRWCLAEHLPAWRHRCAAEPLSTSGVRRSRLLRPSVEQRNQRMVVDEGPGLILIFHEDFAIRGGRADDMCLRALRSGIPAWLVPTADPNCGMWLDHSRLGAS